MPELPEVETTLRGVSPHINGKTVSGVILRTTKLRWPLPPDLSETLRGQTVQNCRRRAKYLLIEFAHGVLIIHLGMSGSLRIFTDSAESQKHDHADIVFADGTVLRYHDPRRFGAILWLSGVAEHHPLLADLGPEPLDGGFSGCLLHRAFAKQNRAVKTALMDNAVVVGVGNIYANESLFQAAIAPHRPAKSLSKAECDALAQAVQDVLRRAIDAGGSTLRDFVDSSGKSGYFQQQYQVYGRSGEPCRQCGTPIAKTVIGQRGTFYCPNCQH